MFFAWSKTGHFQLTDSIIEKALGRIVGSPKGLENLEKIGKRLVINGFVGFSKPRMLVNVGD